MQNSTSRQIYQSTDMQYTIITKSVLYTPAQYN